MNVLLHGKTGRPTGFSLINRRLIDGLRSRGHTVTVCSMDDDARPPRFGGIPDVYLFHGDPFDFDHPVGRTNVFFFSWEYRRLPSRWVDQLNRRFDLVLVPSRATADACRRSGVRRLIRRCPAAVDRKEIHPRRRPARLPTGKSFRFLHFGGAHERRGTDILLRAYAEEFSADDDVCLILKGFHYDHHRPWLERVIRRCGLQRRGAPELCYTHETLPSVAPLLTATDVGVFPLRAECTGLPVLECIAAGRPVIVTAGTGLDDFCRAANSRTIRATAVERNGLAQWQPDLAQLKRHMRDAYRRGRLSGAARDRIAGSVRAFTWQRSVDCALDAFHEAAEKRPCWPASRPPRRRSTWVAPPFAPRALTRFAGRHAQRDRPLLAIGALGASLEAFREATERNAAVLTAVFADGLPAAQRAEAENRLRRRYGLAPRPPAAIDVWCEQGELTLADGVGVPSRRLAEDYERLGVERSCLGIVGPRFPRRRFVRPPRGLTRFLFASNAPLSGGLLPLLRAWDALRPAAELVVVCPADVWAARDLLSLLVRNPSVVAVRDRGERALHREIERCHFVVAPDVASPDYRFVAEAMARGRAAIVSAMSPVAEVLTDGVDGWIVAASSVPRLRDAVAAAAGQRRRATHLGRAARRTSGRFADAATPPSTAIPLWALE